MTIRMRFNIQGMWEEKEVESVAEFQWEGLNFILHKNIIEPFKFRVSHRESGTEIWSGDDPLLTKRIAIGMMDIATKGGVARSILKELGVGLAAPIKVEVKG